MNSSSTDLNVSENVILLFFILGGLLAITGIFFNFCLCFIFYHEKSLSKTSYGIFIIALSITDIIKLTAEYILHIAYFYIQHPYFVCSLTWFLTMISENLSYSFLCALGIERNLKVWAVDQYYLITRQRAYIITIILIVFVFLHDHFFLFPPYQVSYSFVHLYNHSILFSCDNAYYESYGYKYSLTDLIFIQSIGLNNFLLPLLILTINFLLIIGLKRRLYQRRNRLGRRKTNDWKEQNVIFYVLLSSIAFVLLTSPTGILSAWSSVFKQKLITNNLAIILELMEIVHHCSHFPILLMTSSVIRNKTAQRFFHFR